MKAISRIAGMFALLASAVVSCEQLPGIEPVTVELNKELISNLPVGSEQTLVATLTPEGSEVTVVWSSDNEAVAVVNSEGVVTGVAPGEAVITAKAGESSATCKVVVTAVKATAIELNESELELGVDGTFMLEYTLTPSNAVADDIEWSSSDETVATVENGLVTAHAAGDAVITVKCNDNTVSATCQVKVVAVKETITVTAIELTPETMSLTVGSEMSLVWNVLPENATDKTVVFSVEGDCITVDENGKVTANAVGEAVVTVTAADGSGIKAQCSVNVTSDNSIKAIYLNSSEGTDLQVGKTLQLHATYAPEDAAPVSVSWTVDNPDYAQVSQSGEVKGLSAYYDESNKAWSTVRVKLTADGVSGEIVLRVIPRQPEEIMVDLPENAELRIGEEWNFNPRLSPEGLPFQIACYGATLDPYSTFVSNKPGNAAISFYISDHNELVYGNMQRHVNLNIIPYWVETVILPETLELEAGSSHLLAPSFTSDVDGIQPTYTDVVWSSSDNSIASVNEKTGEITAVAEGTVEITATTSNDWSVPEGTEQRSATCVVTVKPAKVALNIGDYYYSDGTWSSELDASKTVIGVVFSKTNAVVSDPQLASDHPGCTHGLVISVDQYVAPCAKDRKWGRAALIDWMNQNGYGYFTDVDKYCGYGSTKGLIALNEAQVMSYEDTVRVDYCEAVIQHRDKVSAPSESSDWYIPSLQEMKSLYEHFDVVNSSLENAGGTVLVKTYTYTYDRMTGSGPVPTTGTGEQHYYYSNNVTENFINAFNMQNASTVTPKVQHELWSSTSGEQTELPVRIVLAF